ncbi:MAG: methionyl-tRNA formyltransferase, partial [Silvanigrellaceae bacterium]|nr:methionyl-tRNA formyltransferase [Silvanigrellaceae bacterium]
MGTPEIAALALDVIFKAENLIQIVLAVTQPPTRASRGSGMIPSPLQEYALKRGIPVVSPPTAKDPEFLSCLHALEPDLCITAAYGNLLPKEFLQIPKFGTLNIHPSLLPKYRGAAPVQRALEDGLQETGVSVLFTEFAMDAGPILAQQTYRLDEQMQAPQVLKELFLLGAQLLVNKLPSLFAGRAKVTEQNHAQATKAHKLKVEEGVLDFSLHAKALHNKVRAFTPWPSTKAFFLIDEKPVEIKILTTQVLNPN